MDCRLTMTAGAATVIVLLTTRIAIDLLIEKNKMKCVKYLKWMILALLIVAQPAFGYSVRVGQSLLLSGYDETTGFNPFAQEEGSSPDSYLGPIYTMAFYFLDARVQELGKSEWSVRSNTRVKRKQLSGAPLTQGDLYEAELRNLFVENHEPVGGHWFFSAGRMRSPFMLPVQRLDGLMAAYTPSDKKDMLLGVIGGMVPLEITGYRDYYYPAYRAGAFLESKVFDQGKIKLQYNAGFDDGGADPIHQALFQGQQNYRLFDRKAYIRTGFLFTMPNNIIDYGFIENGINWKEGQTHSLSLLRSETLYRLSETETHIEEFQEIYYRLYYKTEGNKIQVNAGGGYSGNLSHNGYVGEVKVSINDIFLKRDNISLDFRVRDRGLTNSLMLTAGYGIFQFYILDFQLFAGYEKFQLRDQVTPVSTVGLSLESTIASEVYFQMEFESRNFQVGGVGNEVTLTGIFSYYFRYRSKEKADEPIETIETTQ